MLSLLFTVFKLYKCHLSLIKHGCVHKNKFQHKFVFYLNDLVFIFLLYKVKTQISIYLEIASSRWRCPMLTKVPHSL